jgi:predicted DNA-binding ribbon-helix-helix protein
LSLNALVTEIDKVADRSRGSGANLSVRLRVYVLKQLRRKISRA